MIIALDAMGGDFGPKIVAEGAYLFSKLYPSTRFLMCGDQAKIKPFISSDFARKIDILHTEDEISPDTKPSAALRKKKSSMMISIDSVIKKEADAVVSSGNTGAFMALSLFNMGAIQGVFRPAIGGFLPNKNGDFSVMLDLGANSENDALQLLQFAAMGEVLARIALNKDNPKIALLNIGSEDIKGNPTLQKAAQLVREENLFKNFIGFVEGDQLTSGDSDVIVADGFSGNIAIKSAEGAAKFTLSELKKAVSKSVLAKFGLLLAMRSLKAFQERLNPSNYNGAIFLGIQGIAVKSHGSTNAKGFCNAIKIAQTTAGMNLVEALQERLSLFPKGFLKGDRGGN